MAITYRELLEDVTRRVRASLKRLEEGGYWERGDSAVYAWTCGGVLSALIELYKATRDPKWLDTFRSAVDRMFATLKPDGRFLSWKTRLYSGTLVSVRPSLRNRSRARLRPREQWVYNLEVARRVTRDLKLKVIFEGSKGKRWVARVEEEAKRGEVAMLTVEEGKEFLLPPGVSLTLEGHPSAGDKFFIVIRRPKELAYAVHDGVILTPICRFLLLGGRRGQYLRTIEARILPKWDEYWRDLGRRGGVLVFPLDKSFRYPGITLPHNQYLALGRVYILLWRLTRREEYRRKAEKMAKFFKSCLKRVDGRYFWHYWDPAGSWDDKVARSIKLRAEDTSHGALDIGFVIEAEEAKVVFTTQDLRLFAGTFVKAMWNGSLDNPQIGGWVDGRRPGRGSGTLQEWVRLCKVEPLVLRICERAIPKFGSLHARAQLLSVLAERSGR